MVSIETRQIKQITEHFFHKYGLFKICIYTRCGMDKFFNFRFGITIYWIALIRISKNCDETILEIEQILVQATKNIFSKFAKMWPIYINCNLEECPVTLPQAQLNWYFNIEKMRDTICGGVDNLCGLSFKNTSERHKTLAHSKRL